MTIWLDIVRPTGWPIVIDITCKMRCIEFLHLFFSEFQISNWNSDFSIFQQRNLKKKIWPESSESKTESEFCFQWRSQKSEPKIRIPNLVGQCGMILSQVTEGGVFSVYGVSSMLVFLHVPPQNSKTQTTTTKICRKKKSILIKNNKTKKTTNTTHLFR